MTQQVQPQMTRGNSIGRGHRYRFLKKLLLIFLSVSLAVWGLSLVCSSSESSHTANETSYLTRRWQRGTGVWSNQWSGRLFHSSVKDSNMDIQLEEGADASEQGLPKHALRKLRVSWVRSRQVAGNMPSVRGCDRDGGGGKSQMLLKGADELATAGGRRRLGVQAKVHVGDTSGGNRRSGPWTTAHKSEIRGIPECTRLGLIPAEFWQTPDAHMKAPIRTEEDLKRPGLRTFAVLSNGGMGNSLRGYISGWVYSLLSGRRIVLINCTFFHREVFGDLYNAMDIRPDIVHISSQVAWNFTTLMHPPPLTVPKDHREIVDSLAWSNPVVYKAAFTFWDDYWYTNSSIRECVYRATACEDEWCVHSRALRHLFRNGPKSPLKRAAQRIVRFSPKLNTNTTKLDVVADGMETTMRFDFGLHIRTIPPSLEYRNMTVENCTNSYCVHVFEWSKVLVDLWRDENTTWSCLGELFSGGPLLRLPSMWKPWDFEHQWPQRGQDKRSKVADNVGMDEKALTSNGKVGKQAFHRRALLGALQHAGSKGLTFKRDDVGRHGVPSVDQGSRRRGGRREERGRPEGDGVYVDSLLRNVQKSLAAEMWEGKDAASRRKLLHARPLLKREVDSASARKEGKMDGAEGFAAQAKVGASRYERERLVPNIYMATDNEEMRMEIVERLRQFGNVFYQDSPVVHTSHDKEEMDRMPTMVDFYFLSQADVQVGLKAYLSTFSETAAILSNATLMYFNGKYLNGTCLFEMMHHNFGSPGPDARSEIQLTDQN